MSHFSKIHVSTDIFQKIQRLAEEAVISNSILLVKGASGSGKSHIGEALSIFAQREKDRFPFKVHRVEFFNVDDAKSILMDVLDQIGHTRPTSSSHIPRLVRTLAQAIIDVGGGLLFFDNVNNVKERDLTVILEAVKIARRSIRVGMLMTSSSNQSEFEFLTQNPRYLAQCNLATLPKPEVLKAMVMMQPRLSHVSELLKKDDSEAISVFQHIYQHIQGNFERIISFLSSLEHACKDGTVTTDSLRLVLKRREGY